MARLAAGAVLLALMVAPAAGDESCAALDAAIAKGLHTPYRSEAHFTSAAAHLDFDDQFIVSGDIEYTRRRAAGVWSPWRPLPHDPATVAADAKRVGLLVSCRLEATVELDGEQADIVSAHHDKPSWESRLWIGKRLGLLLRNETAFPDGARVEQSWSYDDVELPAADGKPPRDVSPIPSPLPLPPKA